MYLSRQSVSGPRKAYQAKFPDSLKIRLDAAAAESKQSVNGFIGALLAASLKHSPSLNENLTINEPLNPAQFTVRLPTEVMFSIQNCSLASGRTINLEILIRLTLAMASWISPEVKIARDLDSGSHRHAWHRLNAAIEAAVQVTAPDSLSTAAELQAAREEYLRALSEGSGRVFREAALEELS
jgi:hypothetical protein